MLDDLPPHARRRLFAAVDERVAEIGLDEQDHFFVADENFVGTDGVQPALHRAFDAGFVFLGANAGGGGGGGDGGDDAFGVGGEEVVGEFLELVVSAADVAELGGAEFREVGLGEVSCGLHCRWWKAYVDIELEDGVFATGALQGGDLAL